MRRTAEPRSRASRMIARTSSRPTGSSADVGSSRITSAGSPRSAARQPEALLHALGEAAGPVVGAPAEADEREDALDLGAPARRRQPREPRVEVQDLAGGEPRLVAEQLGR